MCILKSTPSVKVETSHSLVGDDCLFTVSEFRPAITVEHHTDMCNLKLIIPYFNVSDQSDRSIRCFIKHL